MHVLGACVHAVHACNTCMYPCMQVGVRAIVAWRGVAWRGVAWRARACARARVRACVCACVRELCEVEEYVAASGCRRILVGNLRDVRLVIVVEYAVGCCVV